MHSALPFHLNKVIHDGFAGHVTTEAVVPLQEVWSEMMQERVQVQRVVAVPPAVNTLTALQNTQFIQNHQLHTVTMSFCCSYTEQQRHKEAFSVFFFFIV